MSAESYERTTMRELAAVELATANNNNWDQLIATGQCFPNNDADAADLKQRYESEGDRSKTVMMSWGDNRMRVWLKDA